MASFDQVPGFLAQEDHLAVVSTVRSNGEILSSVANCAVIDHPVTGKPCLAFVSIGKAARLSHIRSGSPITVTVRRGWEWLAVSGQAELIGPVDDQAGLDAGQLAQLLRDIFVAAGGSHDDWDEYDRAMREEARTAVLIEPTVTRGNGGD